MIRYNEILHCIGILGKYWQKLVMFQYNALCLLLISIVLAIFVFVNGIAAFLYACCCLGYFWQGFRFVTRLSRYIAIAKRDSLLGDWLLSIVLTFCDKIVELSFFFSCTNFKSSFVRHGRRRLPGRRLLRNSLTVSRIRRMPSQQQSNMYYTDWFNVFRHKIVDLSFFFYSSISDFLVRDMTGPSFVWQIPLEQYPAFLLHIKCSTISRLYIISIVLTFTDKISHLLVVEFQTGLVAQSPSRTDIRLPGCSRLRKGKSREKTD